MQVPEAEDVNVEDETWQKEQDYIQSLAHKYCLEQYQDSYAMMCKYYYWRQKNRSGSKLIAKNKSSPCKIMS